MGRDRRRSIGLRWEGQAEWQCWVNESSGNGGRARGSKRESFGEALWKAQSVLVVALSDQEQVLSCLAQGVLLTLLTLESFLDRHCNA